MQLTVMQTRKDPARAEIIEKKSRFIGLAVACSSALELSEFLDDVRARYLGSRHVAFAALYRDGEDKTDGTGSEGVSVCEGPTCARMSDDGEPSGTAGKPILEVLRRRRLADCAVAVPRYFGGVLLGSGGLIRAYSTAASQALDAADTVALIPSATLRVAVGYSQVSILDRLVARADGTVKDRRYAEDVSSDIVLPRARLLLFESLLRDAFRGTVSAVCCGEGTTRKEAGANDVR